MSLKKSDKMIALIGVIIIIVAAVGIFYYVDTEEEITPEKEDEFTTYDIVPIDDEEVIMQEISYTFKKGLLLMTKNTFNDPEFASFPVENLKSIEFNISYRDRKVGGILGILFKNFLGRDKASVIITDPDEVEYPSGNINGNVVITIENINLMIDTTPIEAMTFSEAEMELESRYGAKWKDENFSIMGTHKVGEKLRPILRIRERLDRDTVYITITYTYWQYELKEMGDDDYGNDGDIPPTGSEGSQTWAPMALPGKN